MPSSPRQAQQQHQYQQHERGQRQPRDKTASLPQNDRHRRQLNIDTSIASASHRDKLPVADRTASDRDPDSSPATTPRESYAIERLRHGNESFLDNATPVESTMADYQVPAGSRPRDSHDLSLSPRDVTRDSLVANMLLSLDQFSLEHDPNQFADASAYDDAPQILDTTRTWANQQASAARAANGHQYSYSSDFEGADDSSRMSSQTSRGRRSNSSSNFPPNSYARLNSVRESNDPPRTTTAGATRGAHHSRGGKGSGTSSSLSTDGGYGAGSQRWHRTGGGRSSSVDSGRPQPSLQLQTQMQPQPQPQPQHASSASPFRPEFSSSYLDDDFNAAPTPTVPAGPRRTPSTPAMPPPPPPPEPMPKTSSSERRRSTSRSLKSSPSRKNTMQREAAPVLPPLELELDSAPAPNIGYEKSKDAIRSATAPASTPAKDRPGFFKRMFGGGSSRNASPASTPVSDSHQSMDRVESTGSHQLQSQTSRSPLPRPASPSREAPTTQPQPPTLQKRPSSFFRRRKKSVHDDQPAMPQEPAPPVPPINAQLSKDNPVAMPQPSPVTSLRKAMNPYLRNSVAQGGHGAHQASQPGSQMSPLSDITNTVSERGFGTPQREHREYRREFSSDYEPSPTARIRTVQPDSGIGSPQSIETPTAIRTETRNNSFLHLDDDEDDPIARAREKHVKTFGEENTPRAKQAPFAVEQTDSDEDPHRSKLALPMEGTRSITPASATSSADYRSAKSTHSRPPSVRIDESQETSPKVSPDPEAMKNKGLDEPVFVVGEPTEDDRQKAQQIFDGSEDFIQRGKAAAWMGEEGPVRQRTLQAYMQLYDFHDTSIVEALRQVCYRLILRAETQQVDRVLVAFSKRWCESNPNHGFKAADVIHTICYSIMLLNTDLHMADIENKMTRSQFVKNTMTTIIDAAADAVPEDFNRLSILPEKNTLLSAKNTGEPNQKSFRHSFRAPSRTNGGADELDPEDKCGPLVRTPFQGSIRAWEEQVETVLKMTYVSIRDERLPLFGAEPSKPLPATSSQGNLSVMGMLKRSPSVLSRAPSESQLSLRGRVAESQRSNASRWASKSRSRPGIGRTGFSSSRTSLEDGNSVWSPSLSSATWSRYSLGRTQTSMSQDSFGSSMPHADYQQSIGFANALSQAIIRDDELATQDGTQSMVSDEIPIGQVMEDESLELSGPPWMKEGMVIHKHHLDGVDKKARDRNWTEVFAVVQKGQLSLFSFGGNKSIRQKSRSRTPAKASAVVGGGNWQDNATNMGTFNLRQTLASALPSPGYSRTRPHVWALSLPTGAVHLFQVGTPDIIKEFVMTANYWSARLSTHPLVGAISNIEYGWSEAIVNNSLVAAINESTNAPTEKASRPSTDHGRKSSITSGGFRSMSFDQGSRAFTRDSGRGKLPGDKAQISNWNPPAQSPRASTLREADQLRNLTNYVKSIEAELQTHNQLRSPMLLAYTPRGSAANKAMANWERKSAYLLREIVKYRTYVDCLGQADARKEKIYAERNLAHRAARGELTDADMELSGGEGEAEEGDVTLRP